MLVYATRLSRWFPTGRRKSGMGSKSTRRKSSENDDRGIGLLIAVGGVIWVIVHLIWWILAALVLIVTCLVVRAILAEQRRRTTPTGPQWPIARTDRTICCRVATGGFSELKAHG